MKAAAIDPNNINDVLGGMREITLPRTSGLDFISIVVTAYVAGPPGHLQVETWGSARVGFSSYASRQGELARSPRAKTVV